MARDHGGHGCPPPRELFEDRDHGDEVETEPAEIGAHQRAEQPELGELGDERIRAAPRLLELARHRNQVLVDELPNHERDLPAFVHLVLGRRERAGALPVAVDELASDQVRWISFVPSPMIMSGVSR